MADTFEQWWEANYSTMVFNGAAFVKEVAEKAWKAARGENKPKEPEKKKFRMEILYKLFYKRHAIVEWLGDCSSETIDEAKAQAKVASEKFMEQYKPAEIESWDARVRPAQG